MSSDISTLSDDELIAEYNRQLKRARDYDIEQMNRKILINSLN